MNGCDKFVGNLVYTVAAKFPLNALNHRPLLLKYVVESKIKKQDQVEAALAFLERKGSESFSVEGFEEACGVGVEVSVEEIQASVEKVLDENMAAVTEQRYQINVGNLCGQVRKVHPWADAKAIKTLIDGRLYEIFGERTEADAEKPLKKKKEKKIEEKVDLPASSPVPSPVEKINPFLIFPQPEENSKVDVVVGKPRVNFREAITRVLNLIT